MYKQVYLKKRNLTVLGCQVLFTGQTSRVLKTREVFWIGSYAWASR